MLKTKKLRATHIHTHTHRHTIHAHIKYLHENTRKVNNVIYNVIYFYEKMRKSAMNKKRESK